MDKKVSGTGMRACTSVKQMPDGGYAITGFSNNNAYGSADSMNAMLLRTDSNGNILPALLGQITGIPPHLLIIQIQHLNGRKPGIWYFRPYP